MSEVAAQHGVQPTRFALLSKRLTPTVGPSEQNMTFLEPWFEVTSPDNAPDELKRETSPGHPLHGVSVKTVARRQDCDDVLFKLLDGSGRYAVVHLSFQKEKDPKWPECHLFTDLEDWIENGMKPDHEDWA